MSDSRQAGPTIQAADLMRVNIDSLMLDDLEDHATQVLDTIAALNDYVNSPGRKSADLLRDAVRLTKKLVLHMARVRDLINARKAAAALVQASPAAGTANAGTANAAQGAHPFGR